MTNWHNPSLILAETIAAVKLMHVVGGLYIWEFVWSIGYEYSIVTGRRKFTWSSLPYVAGRWFTLFFIIITFLSLDASFNITCQAMTTSNFAFGAFSSLSASSLVILRTIALWEQRKVVIAMGSALWLVNATAYIYSVSTFRGHQIDGACVFIHSSCSNIVILSTFIMDLVILLLMLSGVLRWRNSRRRGGMWWLLYMQGLAWVVVFTLAGLPSVIFIILDLNGPMNQIFLFPEVVFMTICASRMHLGLSAALHGHPHDGLAGDREQQLG
ncbi:hypothetical protein BC827DRAFT_48052 [Russula dissimulans]|nr:hypothetical protein BC827DRAFT_48052 [Russula dissimulans]